MTSKRVAQSRPTKECTIVMNVLSSDLVKNNNPDWHWLSKEMQCQLCEKMVATNETLVRHYVNCHPNNEVFPSRVAPDVADFLRNSTEVHKVHNLYKRSSLVHERYKQLEFKQRCYFCNKEKSLTKFSWINHTSVHSGDYRYKCSDCNKRFNMSPELHVCKGSGKSQIETVLYPHLKVAEIFGYLCDFCNFIRFEESEMVTHLRCEHEGNLTTKFKKFTFLNFPKKKREVGSNMIEHKRTNTAETLYNVDAELQDIPSGKVRRTRVKSLEAFERSNSVQEDDEIASKDKEQALDPFACDEGISIGIRTQTDDDYNMEQNIPKETPMEKTPSSTTTDSVSDNNPTPTEEVFDDSNDNWEIYSSDGRENENVKTCVRNGHSSLGYYSFSLNSTNQRGSQLGPRDGNVSGSSSNADATNNDVEMDGLNCPTKVITRICNIGYSSLIGNGITFCCFIFDCEYETMDLGSFLSHYEDHKVDWGGFCMACNAQVNRDQITLMMEFNHMTEAHLNKKDNNDCAKDSGQTEQTPFIKCKVLLGEKLTKLKEAEIAASDKHFTIQDTTQSTSASVVSENSFLKIAIVPSTTTTTTAVTKPDISPFVIVNVTSLDAVKQDYVDYEVVKLKQWARNYALKQQKYYKRMMRDISLFALYKCMDIKCSFTTNDSEHMLTHLRNHENDAILQANNVSGADIPSYLECAYCDDTGDSCQWLVKHIQDEHQSSIFQCPYCFYRSCVAYNVVVHLSQFHQSEQKSVLICNGKPKGYATEKALIEKSRQEFVRPLRCTEDCKKITFVMDYFVAHMKTSPAHSDKFKCHICGCNVELTKAATHLLFHRIGVFECVYCQFGTNDVKSIQHHMCNSHPSKLLYICVRLMRKSQVLTDEQLSSVESTLTVHLGQSVDAKLFQRCPYTEQQLSMLSSSIEKNAVSLTQPSSSLSAQTQIDIEITAASRISNETFSNPSSSSPGLMPGEILSYKDFEKEYVSDDYDKYFANIALPSLPEQPTTSKCKRKSSPVPVVFKLPENTRKRSTPTSRTDLLQDEIDVAAHDLVRGTGLEGSDLYRCGFEDCDEKCNDILAFDVHLLNHNSPLNEYKCYHCSTVFKNIDGLSYHIQMHGIHRYFCYFCDHTSAINSVQKHMQDIHSSTHFNSIALNPKKFDRNKDMFIVSQGPRGLCQEELKQFGRSLMDRNKRKLATTKKFCSSGDIEVLPRQAIDPVNPVTSLDTGEKHFDEMINLACRSNDGKTMQSDPAAFVPKGRRFVCNARQCEYQTIKENKLKWHLITLHTNEDQYKCPHCNTLICQNMDIEKVMCHLHMHDAKIYKCPKCTMVHHDKSMVEKHKVEVHVGCLDEIVLVIRDETTSSTPTHSGDGQPEVLKWKCALCNYLCATEKQIHFHVLRAHCVKLQYQCDICNEVMSNSKAIMQEHMSLNHRYGDSLVKVPRQAIDPVNSVPCLDTGEKHFDEIINLACRSYDGETMQSDPAAFVPKGRRFVCNARQCEYQTIKENKLKWHLITLHTNEDQYKCPHCNTLICQNMDIEKVMCHLHMHDAKIYKCPKCTMVHHDKSMVEKHKVEVHVGCLDEIVLVIRDETTSSSPTHSGDGQPKVLKWKCALCNYLCATENEIYSHVQRAHCIKLQYQCDICNEVMSNSEAVMQEHMSVKHPNGDSLVKVYYTKEECVENHNTPIWQRDDPNKVIQL